AFLPAKKRSLVIDAPPPVLKREITSATASLPSRTSVVSTTYTAMPTYTPEPWGPGDTVTFTTTIESLSKSTYTTEIVLASMGGSSSLSSSSSSSSSSTSSLSSAAPSSSTNPEESPVSTDGVCGANGYTCAGSAFGGCCSEYGYCGDTSAYCGTGCQTAFGTCNAPVSTDGTCSSNSDPEGATCAGSEFGNCCSEWGYCGSTNAYCGTGCQSAFGSCT
ncbi:hypothetical protein EDB81DRAFT_895596, partial [Dactylonectria macrodidyma]